MKLHGSHGWMPGALAGLAVLAGCTVGPRYAEPDVPRIELASPQAAPFAASTAEARPGAWWTWFEDAALTQWMDAALARNHDVRQAAANLLAARAVFDERRLERLPDVAAGADYRRSLQPQAGSGGEPVRMLSQSWRAGFDMQWEIDLFGRLDRLSQAASARAEAGRAELELMRLSVAAEVARSYFEAQGLQRRLALAEQEVLSWRETVGLVELRLRAGSGLPEELENAQSQLRRSEAAIAPLAAALQQAGYRLDVLAGQRPGQGAMGVQAPQAGPLSFTLPLGDADRLIRARPDVLQAERLLAASVADVGAATADLYPRLNLGGFIGFFALRDADLGSAARAFELAPGLHWPVLRMGSARARLRGAQALSEGALARYEQALLRAQEEVENAVTHLSEHQRHLAFLLQSARHAQAALDIAGKRHRAGAGSYAAVLENQRLLLRARQEIAAAETASYLHAVALCKALGLRVTTAAGASPAG